MHIIFWVEIVTHGHVLVPALETFRSFNALLFDLFCGLRDVFDFKDSVGGRLQ